MLSWPVLCLLFTLWLQKHYLPKRIQLIKDQKIQIHTFSAIHWTPGRIQKYHPGNFNYDELRSVAIAVWDQIPIELFNDWWIRCKLAAKPSFELMVCIRIIGCFEHVNKLIVDKALTFNILNTL